LDHSGITIGEINNGKTGEDPKEICPISSRRDIHIHRNNVYHAPNRISNIPLQRPEESAATICKLLHWKGAYQRHRYFNEPRYLGIQGIQA